MNQVYIFEPTKLEIVLTECVGNFLLRRYYSHFVASLGIKTGNRILDYCCGSGIISSRVAKKLNHGRLVYTDVSKRWLAHTANRLKSYRLARGSHLCDFTSVINGGQYDKILVHYVLHDFPATYRISIINQLLKNLRVGGMLVICEPISVEHGIKLYELINLIESTKKLTYEYRIANKPFVGRFIDVRCRLK